MITSKTGETQKDQWITLMSICSYLTTVNVASGGNWIKGTLDLSAELLKIAYESMILTKLKV